MIRSNPTAIPLRANDVKLLQSEIDKRKLAREAIEQQQQQQQQTKTTQAHQNKDTQKNKNNSNSNNNRGDEIFGLGQEKKDKYGKSIADRIGL
ncbi:uncharacterized protein L201_006846 [Kwoniella dendrophila CBS 6074]|uniref:THO1-MOS11 C-terminal domain-containing protein n=1 Tax=Kwoniella dendrophila CBS 6074 TaxID=1295534 RepID=A0AAX4K2X7_9TREE